MVVVPDKKGQGHLPTACFILIPRNDVFETMLLYQKSGFFTSEIQFFFFTWKIRYLEDEEIEAQ